MNYAMTLKDQAEVLARLMVSQAPMGNDLKQALAKAQTGDTTPDEAHLIRTTLARFVMNSTGNARREAERALRPFGWDRV